MTTKERQEIVRIHYAVAHVVLPKGKEFFMPLVRVADEKWVDLKDFNEFKTITDEDVFTSYHAYFDSSGFVPMGVHTNFLLSALVKAVTIGKTEHAIAQRHRKDEVSSVEPDAKETACG